MTPLTYGLLSGALLGAVAIAPMFKMSFPDKRAAIGAAFVERFSIGLVVSLVALPWPRWGIGFVFGLLLSLPSALIVPKARAPILAIGAVGGLLIGLLIPHAVR
ncbi:MAG TPA: hypothetical protein VJ867_13580 [Gemmatimonadaceae bacterium]|nr:hypothetical protein [Gemmatimonadaceae bacterium]